MGKGRGRSVLNFNGTLARAAAKRSVNIDGQRATFTNEYIHILKVY
ncbi:hypothetical protein SF83666_a46410 (plasmid) [Sinorhizobium fredii CCBAU 83666]|nr:hypothetical protein SF83666_a46410 [Sinorhizobium fredii CCBAU 83666]